MVTYKCSKCNKVFKQKGHYKTHLNKKFPCDKSKILNEEIKENPINREPTGGNIDRKYNCNYCEKSFKRNYHLNRHLKTCKTKKKYEEDKK